MKRLFLIVLVSIMSIASARWETVIEDDLFVGKKAYSIGSLNSKNFLVFDCDKSGKLSMALLETTKDPAITAQYARLLVKVDNNDIHNLEAVFQQRNNSYVEINTDDKDSIKLVINELRDARNKFLVGYDINGNQNTITGSIRGSTKAMNSLINACGINDTRGVPAKSKWVFGMGQGIVEHSINNDKGQKLVIACNEGANSDIDHSITLFKGNTVISNGLSLVLDSGPDVYTITVPLETKSKENAELWDFLIETINTPFGMPMEVIQNGKIIAEFDPENAIEIDQSSCKSMFYRSDED